MANLAGQKQFSEIVAEIADSCLNETASTITNPSLARIKQYYNDAYREICSERDWEFLFGIGNFSTVAGQITPYALGDIAMRDIYYISIPQFQRQILFTPFAMWTVYYPGRYTNVGQSIPWWWIPAAAAANNASQVYLFPAANDVYACEYGYKKRVDNLVNDTEVPIIPPEFQDVPILKATFMAFHKLNDPRAGDYMKRYKERYAEMWLKNEQFAQWVSQFRDLNAERAVPGVWDVNRVLFQAR